MLFVASFNHELRNPIGAVLGYLTLALDAPADTLSEPERGFIEKALRGANTLKDLVNDLLDLSKIAAGKMEVNLRPCMLSEIIAGTMNTIEPLARASGASVQVPATIGLPPLLTDSQRVQQILVNLLSNAVKFTGPEGVRLEFQRSAGEGETEWVEVSVIDTGPGISSEDLVKIFEEFEQVAGTKGGTGLGLPISRRLARLIGGDLSVRSAPGRGTAFILRLPQAMSPSASATESDGR